MTLSSNKHYSRRHPQLATEKGEDQKRTEKIGLK